MSSFVSKLTPFQEHKIRKAAKGAIQEKYVERLLQGEGAEPIDYMYLYERGNRVKRHVISFYKMIERIRQVVPVVAFPSLRSQYNVFVLQPYVNDYLLGRLRSYIKEFRLTRRLRQGTSYVVTSHGHILTIPPNPLEQWRTSLAVGRWVGNEGHVYIAYHHLGKYKLPYPQVQIPREYLESDTPEAEEELAKYLLMMLRLIK